MMVKDLTTLPLERQKILNNRYALEKLEEHLGLGGVFFDGELLFTKQQLVDIFDISESTVEKYLASYGDELGSNGYKVLRGQKLSEFKALTGGTVIDYGTKTTALGVFTFRATLNLAMMLVESDPAREMRPRILDIVIDVFAERSGGRTKYINREEGDRLSATHSRISHVSAATRKTVQFPATDIDRERFLAQAGSSLEVALLAPEILAVFKRLAER